MRDTYSRGPDHFLHPPNVRVLSHGHENCKKKLCASTNHASGIRIEGLENCNSSQGETFDI